MLATHDSLTSYKVKSWWLRPFNFLCKCQNKTLEEQYAAGARSFDLRFAKYRGTWYAAHGAMLYNITISEVIGTLITLRGPVYFRVLCEDTVYRKSDAAELARLISSEVAHQEVYGRYLYPLYVQSKRTWEMISEYNLNNQQFADYPVCWDRHYTPAGMAYAVKDLYELQTSDDKQNLIACYSSKFIPCLTAKILTKIALKKLWKPNDVPIVDFI
jgi:hypothetical protein